MKNSTFHAPLSLATIEEDPYSSAEKSTPDKRILLTHARNARSIFDTELMNYSSIKALEYSIEKNKIKESVIVGDFSLTDECPMPLDIKAEEDTKLKQIQKICDGKYAQTFDKNSSLSPRNINIFYKNSDCNQQNQLRPSNVTSSCCVKKISVIDRKNNPIEFRFLVK